jgi:hypothetical protein
VARATASRCARASSESVNSAAACRAARIVGSSGSVAWSSTANASAVRPDIARAPEYWSVIATWSGASARARS